MLLVAIALALAALASCDAPRDPGRTLERVRGHVLTVGAADDPPFLERDGEEAKGIEAELLHGFARSLGARVRWVWGPQEHQFDALHGMQVDIVAGGISAKTPWKSKAALTRPYLEVHEIVGAGTGATPPPDLKGADVTIEEGDAIGAELEKLKAIVKRVPHLGRDEQLVAGTTARVLGLGYTPIRDLTSEQRVLAVPQGENAFLGALERYLAAHHEAVSRAAGEKP